jgi:hypothetical protein
VGTAGEGFRLGVPAPTSTRGIEIKPEKQKTRYRIKQEKQRRKGQKKDKKNETSC